MRVYPKGCRYLRVYDGSIEPMQKTVHRREIRDLLNGRQRAEQFVVVQPRGKQRWYVFRCHWGETARMVMRLPTQDPHALAMAALLGAL